MVLMDWLGYNWIRADIKPESYTGDNIDIIGYRSLIFKFKGRKTIGKLYIAQRGPSVLGWKDQRSLSNILNPNSPDPVLIVSESEDARNLMLKDFSKVFKKKMAN